MFGSLLIGFFRNGRLMPMLGSKPRGASAKMDIRSIITKKITPVIIVVGIVVAASWLMQKNISVPGKTIINQTYQHSPNTAKSKAYSIETLIRKVQSQLKTLTNNPRARKTFIKNIVIILSAAAIIGYLFHRNFYIPAEKPKWATTKRRLYSKELRARLEEKVRERTEELMAANEELKAEIAQRPLDQISLQQHVKQLNCFYGLSKLVEQPELSLEQIFQKTASMIRYAYQYPNMTCARIIFDGIPYKTDNFNKSELSQHAQIKVRGDKTGDIEVYYLGEKTETGQGPFLTEERNLLNAVAERLGRIIELKQAQEKLLLFRNLIERSNDCILVIEPKWGRVLDVNERACDSLGYTRKELLDMTVKDIEEIIPDDSSWQDHVKELKLKGDIIKESRHRRKDGTAFFVEVSLKLVSQQKEDYIIAVTRDITERKQAEQRQAKLIQELKRTNQKVEGINQELKDFAYIVSHDLKAPLRGIKTLADWISVDYKDKLDEEGREQMDLLLARVGRMHNLIDGILQYSRVGRVKEETVQIDLNELIPSVIDMVAPPENITITLENKLPVIECEKTRIMQVFGNLLSNAVKYMDKPKGQVRIGCVEQDDFWKFSVADNGPGIEEKHFERIFRIFQTLSPRDEFESTGVGLTLIKKIIELYGGKIWLQSKVGEGSKFFFTLPKQGKEVADARLEANIAC